MTCKFPNCITELAENSIYQHKNFCYLHERVLEQNDIIYKKAVFWIKKLTRNKKKYRAYNQKLIRVPTLIIADLKENVTY